VAARVAHPRLECEWVGEGRGVEIEAAVAVVVDPVVAGEGVGTLGVVVRVVAARIASCRVRQAVTIVVHAIAALRDYDAIRHREVVHSFRGSVQVQVRILVVVARKELQGLHVEGQDVNPARDRAVSVSVNTLDY